MHALLKELNTCFFFLPLWNFAYRALTFHQAWSTQQMTPCALLVSSWARCMHCWACAHAFLFAHLACLFISVSDCGCYQTCWDRVLGHHLRWRWRIWWPFRDFWGSLEARWFLRSLEIPKRSIKVHINNIYTRIPGNAIQQLKNCTHSFNEKIVGWPA